MTLLLDRPTGTETSELGRRGFLIGAGAAGGLLLAGCGSADEPAAAGSSAPAERTVATDKGDVTVPAAPANVVCADYYGAFAVVDLGLTPVGVSGGGYDTTGAFYGGKLAKVPVVGDYTEPDPERIAARAPDLILRTIDTPDALYRKLSEIAPTVVISFQKLSLLEVTSRLGEVLGRPAQARSLLASYRAKVAALRTRHAEVLSTYTFSFVAVAGDTTFWTLGPTWTDTTVLLDCGIRLAEPARSQREQTREYSFEKLGVLGASQVLLVPAGPDGTTAAPENAPMTGSPVWRNLPAAKAGRVYPIVYGAASLGTGIQLAERMDAVLGELAG